MSIRAPSDAVITAPFITRADFYGADGKPLSRDGMIWFRLNQGSEPAAELQRIIVDNSAGGEKSPRLVFVTK